MEIDDEIKINDCVKLLYLGYHNADVYDFEYSHTFDKNEIGNIITILDIIRDVKGMLAYKVQSKKGITYLRRNAFELVESSPFCNFSEELENLDYLIPLLKKLNIK